MNKQLLVRMWRKGNPSALLVESSMEYLKTLKMELLYDPVILLLGIQPNKPETLIGKNIQTPMFISVLFTIAKI